MFCDLQVVVDVGAAVDAAAGEADHTQKQTVWYGRRTFVLRNGAFERF